MPEDEVPRGDVGIAAITIPRKPDGKLDIWGADVEVLQIQDTVRPDHSKDALPKAGGIFLMIRVEVLGVQDDVRPAND